MSVSSVCSSVVSDSAHPLSAGRHMKIPHDQIVGINVLGEICKIRSLLLKLNTTVGALKVPHSLSSLQLTGEAIKAKSSSQPTTYGSPAAAVSFKGLAF